MNGAGRTLTDPTALLHRLIVDPAWVQDGVVSPQAFTPRPKDADHLSASNKGLSPAQALTRWQRRFPGTRANATATVTAQACRALGLRVLDDSAPGDPHVLIDFTPCSDVGATALALSRTCTLGP